MQICKRCRGCLAEPAYELDLAWSGYVETVGRLVAAVDNDNNPLELNIKNAVRELDSRISDAIMHAMEDGPSLEEKVSARVFHIHIQQASPICSDVATENFIISLRVNRIFHSLFHSLFVSKVDEKIRFPFLLQLLLTTYIQIGFICVSEVDY